MNERDWLKSTAEINELPGSTALLERGIAEGFHIGAQVCVRYGGKTVADFAVGHARDDLRLRKDHRILWLSAGKPLLAVAIAKLWEHGLLAPEEAVARHLPEFGVHGKQEILLWHLLTHTSAYQPPSIDWPRLAWTDIIQRICEARMPEGRIPGEYAAYDAQTGWYLLAEIVWRLTGLPYYQWITTEVLEPLGCTNSGFGMDSDDWTRGVEEDKIAPLHDTTQSAREGRLEKNGAPRWAGDNPARAAAHNPGGGAIGPVRELCAFYEALLHLHPLGNGTGSTSLLQPATVAELTRRWREGVFDETFRHKADWGLGFIINSGRYGWQTVPYGYGKHAGERAFGHGGMQSTIAFADPGHNLAVAVTFNGLPGEPKHNKRAREFATTLYEDLGLSDS